jgi:hypothetical protein
MYMHVEGMKIPSLASFSAWLDSCNIELQKS